MFVLFVAGFGIAAVIRLRQRSEFRDKMRPLVEEDLSDFAQELDSSGGLMANVARREKRIAVVRLFEAGPYRDARDLIVRLMEAENRFTAVREEFYEVGAKESADSSTLDLSMSELNLAARVSASSTCTVLKDALKRCDDLISNMRLSATFPDTVERVRKEGVFAWNAAYGWIKWLGLDIDGHNPFGSLEKTPFQPHNYAADLEKAEHGRSLIAGAIASGCGSAQ